jgi:hypothetical protein
MWSPNPLAIAQLLLGENVPAGNLQELLEQAFAVKEQAAIFDWAGSVAPRFELFQQLADAFSTPQNLAIVLEHPLVVQALEQYHLDPMKRVLPFLVPIADALFTSPGAAAPAHGVTIAGEYRDIGALTLDGASFMDPKQGAVADCYLISAMIALAWTEPEKWDKSVRAHKIAAASGLRYQFQFFSGATTRDPSFEVGPMVPMKADIHNKMLVDRESRPMPYYASSSRPGEAWPAIIEKAYVMQSRHLGHLDPSAADYQLIGDYGREPQVACRMLVGGTCHWHANDISHLTPPLSQTVRANCVPRCDDSATIHPTMAWTWENVRNMHPLGWTSTGLFANHAYAVLGLMKQNDKDYVVLRNPHGDNVQRPDCYAKDEWSARAGEGGVTRVPLNDGGVFAIRADWFDICFDKVGWVELQT